MKVTPVNSPHAVHTPNTTNNTDSRARAIAKLAPPSPQAQETPVLNPNQVSPEEMSAIRAPSADTTETQESSQTTEETIVTPAPEKQQEDQGLKRQFEQLARQERILRARVQKQDQELKAREDSLKAKEAEILARNAEINQDYLRKDLIKRDALGILEEQGLATYEELTQQAMTRQPTDPRVLRTMSAMEEKISNLEKQLETAQQNSTQQQQAQIDAALRQMESDTKALVKSSGDEYELVAKTPGAIKEVVKLIRDTYYKDGVVLTVDEATLEVENELMERSMNSFKTVNKLKKRISETNMTDQKSQQQQAKTQQPQPGMKTLTNAASSTRKLNAKERAMLAFKGELK